MALKLLVVENVDNLNGVVWWRAVQPLSYLRKRMDLDVVFKPKVSMADIMLADAVLMFRTTSDAAVNIIRACKQARKPVIIDIDDDLVNLPGSHPLRGPYNAKIAQYWESVDMADMIWTSTVALAKSIGHPNVHICPNAIDPKDLPDKHNFGKRTILWRGGYTGMGDIEGREEWYKSLSKDYLIRFWGYLPSFAEQGQFLEWQADASQYIFSLSKLQPEYIWKPLQANPFNEAKSNIAFLEATAAGALCLTNMPGADWDGCVENVLTDEMEYDYKFEWSKEFIRDKFNIHKVTEARLSALLSLV
jgi:hypothetical protein